MPKHGSSDRSVLMARSKGKLLALKNYKRCECTECMFDKANAIGIPESTLGTISKETDRIKESCKITKEVITTKITDIRVPIINYKLEKMMA
jgi:hypothetical protein